MPIDAARSKKLLNDILGDITNPDGSAAVQRFSGLRGVDSKTREARMVLQDINAVAILGAMDQDADFQANSRRVRLEALANICSTALRFLESGVIQPQRKRIFKAPDMSAIITIMPSLEPVIQQRWLEAQKCQHAKAYLSSVIMMGSILEALLLARCSRDPATSYQAKGAPKNKDGSPRAIQDWTLHQLIEVATAVGWLKSDRGAFSHALRESRNIVHPIAQLSARANFDEATCTTCWHVLNASVEDLVESA